MRAHHFPGTRHREVRARPGLAVPAAWNALEAGVRAVLGRGRTPREAADRLGALTHRLGTKVPGLPGGLTHTFPDAAAIARGEVTQDEAALIEALAADVARGHGALDHGTGLEAPATLPYADHDLRHDLAFRLGSREAFPLGDASLRAALAGLGLDPAACHERWRPWRSLAAVHLMAHGDGL
ncbi:hypothetical protein [Nonomuraea sp. NPDC049695]|uniref:hypothetical protein n=1 Tax=Nonomuraea sp. NPDC049695 TaxID=3154734 RepID=UPI00342811AB